MYDRAPGDVPRIALLPAWNTFDVWNGESWLSGTALTRRALARYRQTLDLRTGTLRTTYEWSRGRKRLAVDVSAFVSRADPTMAVVHLRLVPGFAGRITVTFPLREWPAPERLPFARAERWDPSWTLARAWYPGHMSVVRGDANALTARVDGGTTTVAIAQLLMRSGRFAGAEEGAADISFDASPGAPVTFTKIVGVVVGRDGSDPMPRARAAIRRGREVGHRELLARHVAAWARLWEADVEVDGDSELQRLVHAMLFYLLASTREKSADSIPPMGLSSAGYYGHIFWDADTWMFPVLAVLHPAIARSIVAFRSRTLAAAKRNARRHGHRGAMYPWEADERGEETTPRWARQNAVSEIHVTADVALAQWQYFLATGDAAWLAREGYPVIKAAADFWVSRVRFDRSTGRCEIRDIVSVDEDLIGVSNDTYTNAAARRNLEIAIAASRRLGSRPNPLWGRVAAGLPIPYDVQGEYHPTYEGAPPETRGSVVPLLAYPLAVPMSDRAKRNDLDLAVRRLGSGVGGAMMTVTFYPLVAAELADRALMDTLLPRTFEAYLREPFDVLAETPASDAVNFLTGAGGFLQQVLFGYTGLRFHDEGGLRGVFRPMLPSRVRRLVLRNVSIRGKRGDVTVERGRLRIQPVAGVPSVLPYADPQAHRRRR